MRAIVQEGSGSPDVLKLREIARPAVGDDEVLVRVRAASVNAADCHMLKMPRPVLRLMGDGRKVLVPGIDIAGHVEAVGAKVTRFKPGDEVFGAAKGAFAEYATTREDRLAAKPKSLSFKEAAALPVAGLTALQGLRDKARMQPGEGEGKRVMIHGAGGGVGTFAVQIAKALGAHVTAVTGPRNLDVVRSLHPDQIIDYTREDFAARGEKFDVFFDIAATRSLRDCLSVLVPKGVLVGVGAPKEGGVGAVLLGLLGTLVMSAFASQRVLMFIAKSRADDLRALAELADAGKVRAVIDREYTLADTAEAMRYVTSGQARAKVIINVDPAHN
jgi:NADPH:quinone reductase-like Zn-dependent oxidoreductase